MKKVASKKAITVENTNLPWIRRAIVWGSTITVSLAIAITGINTVSAAPNCDGKDALSLLNCVTPAYGGATTQTPGQVIARVLMVFLGFLGLIFLLLMLYAGFTWMTSLGDPGKIKTSKETIKNSVIGLALIISAELISYWVVSQLAQQIGG